MGRKRSQALEGPASQGRIYISKHVYIKEASRLCTDKGHNQSLVSTQIELTLMWLKGGAALLEVVYVLVFRYLR